LALLANQTAWTQAVMAKFTKFTRLTVRVQADIAHGIGGAVAAVRFTPNPRDRKALVEWLNETALPKAVARPGMVGGMAAENDLEVAHAPLQAKSMDSPRADEAEWVALLEGSDAGAVGAAARATFTLAKLRNFGVTVAPTIGTYRFLFGNQR
jgi:hypothetical protein